MSYSIRYNRTTNHIADTHGNAHIGDNHCGSLTRGNLAEGKSFETAAEALAYIETAQRRTCKTCTKMLIAAAEAEAAAQVVETPAAEVVVTEVRDLPKGVWMDQKTGILFGQARAMKDLLDSGRARINRAGDLVLR